MGGKALIRDHATEKDIEFIQIGVEKGDNLHFRSE